VCCLPKNCEEWAENEMNTGHPELIEKACADGYWLNRERECVHPYHDDCNHDNCCRKIYTCLEWHHNVAHGIDDYERCHVHDDDDYHLIRDGTCNDDNGECTHAYCCDHPNCAHYYEHHVDDCPVDVQDHSKDDLVCDFKCHDIGYCCPPVNCSQWREMGNDCKDNEWLLAEKPCGEKGALCDDEYCCRAIITCVEWHNTVASDAEKCDREWPDDTHMIKDSNCDDHTECSHELCCGHPNCSDFFDYHPDDCPASQADHSKDAYPCEFDCHTIGVCCPPANCSQWNEMDGNSCGAKQWLMAEKPCGDKGADCDEYFCCRDIITCVEWHNTVAVGDEKCHVNEYDNSMISEADCNDENECSHFECCRHKDCHHFWSDHSDHCPESLRIFENAHFDCDLDCEEIGVCCKADTCAYWQGKCGDLDARIARPSDTTCEGKECTEQECCKGQCYNMDIFTMTCPSGKTRSFDPNKACAGYTCTQDDCCQ